MNASRQYPAWMVLGCKEKIVYIPSSLYGIAFAKVLDSSDRNGKCGLELIYHLHGRLPNVPINVIYKRNCTILSCWTGEVCADKYHQHTETSAHFKFLNPLCRQARKAIVHAYQHDIETTIIDKSALKRKPNVRAVSCKRRLFD